MVYNIENGGILIQEEGRGSYRSKSKKRKLKTKNQSVVRLLSYIQMNKSPQYYHQTETKHYQSEVEEMYSPKPGNWPSQHVDIFENKY